MPDCRAKRERSVCGPRFAYTGLAGITFLLRQKNRCSNGSQFVDVGIASLDSSQRYSRAAPGPTIEIRLLMGAAAQLDVAPESIRLTSGRCWRGVQATRLPSLHAGPGPGRARSVIDRRCGFDRPKERVAVIGQDPLSGHWNCPTASPTLCRTDQTLCNRRSEKPDAAWLSTRSCCRNFASTASRS
jgi:hypothetical protein